MTVYIFIVVAISLFIGVSTAILKVVDKIFDKLEEIERRNPS